MFATPQSVAAGLVEVVQKLREQVQVHEIETVSAGSVPREMLGWWMPTESIDRWEIAEPTVGCESPTLAELAVDV